VVEFAWLVRAAKWQPRDAFFRLAPGALMMIALRAALTGQDWRWIALARSMIDQFAFR